METFEGKVVQVTGGTSGIGRATAIAFATQGIRINAICPGIMETEMTAGLKNDPARGSGFARRIRLGALAKWRKSPRACFTFALRERTS